MGYKAGMTHVFIVDDHPKSRNFGKEVIRPVTVLDTPPILVCAIRAYTRTAYGLQVLTEAWMKDPPEDLSRVFTLPENFNHDKKLQKIEENLDKIAELYIIAITQPKIASISKKKPDIMEIKVDGGPKKEQIEYIKARVGRLVPASDVLKEGKYVDIIAVTKGKGFQGPVKRWGIKILPRKSRKTKRGVACIGPWKPSRVMYSVPRAGQMGYHQRVEHNKRILKMGNNGKEVSVKGGFLRYGLIKGPYILVEGSVPGPAKRLIRIRYPARPPKKVPDEPPNITYVSLESP
jgi:large subunit ribosomal protein L3